MRVSLSLPKKTITMKDFKDILERGTPKVWRFIIIEQDVREFYLYAKGDDI